MADPTRSGTSGRRRAAAASAGGRPSPLTLLALLIPLLTVAALALVRPADPPVTTHAPTEVDLDRATAVCPARLPGADDVVLGNTSLVSGDLAVRVDGEDTTEALTAGVGALDERGEVVVSAQDDLAPGLVVTRAGSGSATGVHRAHARAVVHRGGRRRRARLHPHAHQPRPGTGGRRRDRLRRQRGRRRPCPARSARARRAVRDLRPRRRRAQPRRARPAGLGLARPARCERGRRGRPGRATPSRPRVASRRRPSPASRRTSSGWGPHRRAPMPAASSPWPTRVTARCASSSGWSAWTASSRPPASRS